MRIIPALLACAAIAGVATPASAQDEAGKWQVKLMGTAVLPDGKIDKVNTDLVGLPSNLQTKASDNYVPTLAIEYFFTPNVSLETICCVTEHHVTGTTGLPGAGLVSKAHLIPATFTLKYHLNAGGVSPYIGAGPSYFIWFGEKPGATAAAAGADKVTLSDKVRIRTASRHRCAAEQERSRLQRRCQALLREDDRPLVRRWHEGDRDRTQDRSMGAERRGRPAVLISRRWPRVPRGRGWRPRGASAGRSPRRA